MIQRFDYDVASAPRTEPRSAMPCGISEGQIGGIAAMALDNLQDITRSWVQYNDQLELA